MYNRSCLYLHRPRYRQYTHVEQYITDSGQPLHNGNAHAPDDRDDGSERDKCYQTKPVHEEKSKKTKTKQCIVCRAQQSQKWRKTTCSLSK